MLQKLICGIIIGCSLVCVLSLGRLNARKLPFNSWQAADVVGTCPGGGNDCIKGGRV